MGCKEDVRQHLIDYSKENQVANSAIDGYGEALFTTEIDFNSNELIKAFFYTDPLSAFFANECGFEIISPSGEVVVYGGDNPILNPIRFSPYMYSGLGQCLETCIPASSTQLLAPTHYCASLLPTFMCAQAI